MTVVVDRPARHVLLVTIDRQERRNAFDTQTARRLREVLSSVDEQTRAVVLTGAGGYFCAGADLKERRDLSDEEWQAQHRLFEDAFATLRRVAVPTLAAVEGAALGGGFELALSCDLIVSSKVARFGFPEVTRGIIPGCGGAQLLARRAGVARAKEAVLTGRSLTATEAAGWNVVNELVAQGEAVPRAVEQASSIAANAPIAVREAKWAIDAGVHLPLEDAVKVELIAYARVVPTEDRREGMRAFDERRPPQFVGR